MAIPIHSKSDDLKPGKYILYRNDKEIGILIVELNNIIRYDNDDVYLSKINDILINNDDRNLKFIMASDDCGNLWLKFLPLYNVLT